MAKYRNQKAKGHEEVLTPPELVEEIYSYLKKKDLKGDVLDPCVGGGALITPILQKPKFSHITLCDIQKYHIKKMKKKLKGKK